MASARLKRSSVDDVRFRLLGPMEIVVHGVPAALPGTAERALLVQLLLSPGRTIPATMLVDRLWSASSLPVNPMNALQIRVSKLRRGLAAIGLGDIVTREGIGYRAHVSPSAVDAVDFVERVRLARTRSSAAGTDCTEEHLEAYDSALGLWRGQPLSDFNTESWATLEITRLTELKVAAVTERATIALALGRNVEVTGQLEPLVAQDPTLESLAGLLMVAMYRSGRQADALAVYSRTRSTLDDALGLEPSVSLRSLHERVLRQDESLGGPGEASVPTPVLPRSRSRVSRLRPGSSTNLPAVLRPLIGRDDQLDALCALVSESRLVTLVGPGGSGKTSLALAATARMAKGFRDGAAGVRLASVNGAEQVPLAVADGLGVPLDGAAAERDVRERILAYLADRHLLLMTDNCEHVIDAAAGMLDGILGRCPGVTVLATSREALAIPDEVQLSVGPLDSAPEATSPSEILNFPASQLFVERARSVRPGMTFTADDLLAVGRIGRSLDGMPLALELAAARVAAMSPSEIADRLTDRFALLTTGARTAEARQQTLRATVDWSYALLDEKEQTVFNRLSVFRGGWTLQAAEEVVGDERMVLGQVLDTMGRLVEQSMVVVEPGPRTRYRMLETLRQYAAEQLSLAGEMNELSDRHSRYFGRLAAESAVQLRGQGQREALSRLREDHTNIRAALTWLGGPAGDPEAALEMGGSLGLFWHLGRHLEGREVLGRLLADAETAAPASRAAALQAVSLVERPRACLVHPSPRCAETAAESLAIYDELGDATRGALSRVLLAVEGVAGGGEGQSEKLLREAHAQFVRDDDPWGQAVIGFVRMETGLKSGDEEGAVRVGRETAAAFGALDDPWGLSAILYHLGWGMRQFGRYEEGAVVLEEAIDVAADAGLYNTVQWALADLGVTLLHLQDKEGARDAFDRADATSDFIGDGAGASLAAYGYGLLAQGERSWSEARDRFLTALDGFRLLGTPVPQGLAIAGLARCHEAAGDSVAAEDGYQQAQSIGETAGEPGLTATALEGLSRLASTRGDDDEAEKLRARSVLVRERAHRPAPPLERLDIESFQS